jgi:hypothetical protein
MIEAAALRRKLKDIAAEIEISRRVRFDDWVDEIRALDTETRTEEHRQQLAGELRDLAARLDPDAE